MSINPDYEIYFDLKCLLCHADAKWLMSQRFAPRFRLVNFRKGERGSTIPEIPLSELEKQLHMVKISSGETYVGVQAVIEILSMSRVWAWAAYFLRLRLVYPVAWFVYRTFSWTRQFLPKRTSCEL